MKTPFNFKSFKSLKIIPLNNYEFLFLFLLSIVTFFLLICPFFIFNLQFTLAKEWEDIVNNSILIFSDHLIRIKRAGNGLIKRKS